MLKYFVRSASFLFFVGAVSGCHVSLTSTDTCEPDSTVGCASGMQGYSCEADVTPATSTLDCEYTDCFGDICDYCCQPVAATMSVPASCSSDPSVVGCVSGSYGYSCTGSASPDSSDSNLFCSGGTPATGETLYCCFFTASTTVGCTADSTVASICNSEGVSYGFSCTGGATPDETFSNITCGAPGTDGTNATYCCNAAGTTAPVDPCSVDTSLFCTGGGVGYACTGSAAPSVPDCGAPFADATGATDYCCGGVPDTCGADPTVTGCQTGATGYTCTGSATPSGTPVLWCDEGVPGTNGETPYCCVTSTLTSTTCVQQPTVCGTAGAHDFACSGTDTPADADSALTCGTGTAGTAGNTIYCCSSGHALPP
jgi:hypothetical protein